MQQLEVSDLKMQQSLSRQEIDKYQKEEKCHHKRHEEQERGVKQMQQQVSLANGCTCARHLVSHQVMLRSSK